MRRSHHGGLNVPGLVSALILPLSATQTYTVNPETVIVVKLQRVVGGAEVRYLEKRKGWFSERFLAVFPT